MLCNRRERKKRRKGSHLYSIAIRQKLQIAKPAITAVAVPASAKSLGIKNHLCDRFPIHSLFLFKSDMTLNIIRASNMPGNNDDHIGRWIDQLFPHGLAIIGIFNRVTF